MSTPSVVDRLQLAVPDIAEAARGWQVILGAEHDRDDRVDCLGARRSTYRLGTGCIEILEPDGTGDVADAVRVRGGHLFAAGLAMPDVEGFGVRLASAGVVPHAERGQLFLDSEMTGGYGLRLVVSEMQLGTPIGLVGHIYEVTNLVDDAERVVDHYTELFGLDRGNFHPITSEHYGYAGTLTLFAERRLDRLEVITATDSTKTMGRFYDKWGPALYMAFGESDDLAAIAERAVEHGAGLTVEPAEGKRDEHGAHTLFLHPNALGGMMLGISRRNFAWQWSGHPERTDPGA